MMINFIKRPLAMTKTRAENLCIKHKHCTMQSVKNTAHYYMDLDTTQPCCGSKNSFTMEFCKGIIGK